MIRGGRDRGKGFNKSHILFSDFLHKEGKTNIPSSYFKCHKVLEQGLLDEEVDGLDKKEERVKGENEKF